MVGVAAGTSVAVGAGAVVGTDVGLGGTGVSARATTGALVGGGVGGITVGTDACCGALGAGDAAGALPSQATMNASASTRAIPTVADLKLRPVPIDVRISLIGATCACRFSKRVAEVYLGWQWASIFTTFPHRGGRDFAIVFCSRRLLLFLVECSIAVTRTAYKQYDA